MYCCLAAGLNERNRMIGSLERVDMKDVRSAIAESVRKDVSINDDFAMAALEQDPEFNSRASNANAKLELVESIEKRKQGTELDLRHFVRAYADVGVITFNGRTGKVYRIDPDEGKRKHYILILWDYARRVGNIWDNGRPFNDPGEDPQHYRNLAFEDVLSKEFRFVYYCNDLPWYVQKAVEQKYPNIDWCE